MIQMPLGLSMAIHLVGAISAFFASAACFAIKDIGAAFFWVGMTVMWIVVGLHRLAVHIVMKRNKE